VVVVVVGGWSDGGSHAVSIGKDSWNLAVLIKTKKKCYASQGFISGLGFPTAPLPKPQ